MDILPIIIVIIGAVIGYVVVSKFFGSKPATATGSPSSPKHKPWHEVLGVAPDASEKEIEMRYYKLVENYDTTGVEDLSPELIKHANEQMEIIRKAYEEARRR